ncbi:MAG: sulfate adenylyltransferase [Bacteroidetes bacterium]|nr:sulfate adenylyltransferase [Bacteroidota bacterium]
MQVLKIATAGSVDDGKSTLIGRLLYDTNSLPSDKLDAIRESSLRKGFDYLDFSLATDGLVAEREQGITIDVAHIYFSTPKRRFIIADAPGHVEFTRNMVTGASNAQVSIILIDARKGVVEQTFRHFYINSLLRIKNLMVVVNKMDLVGFDKQRFLDIKKAFETLAEKAGYQQQISYVPISALHGDNVATLSDKMPWYTGDTVLDLLESIQVDLTDINRQARFAVQHVIRPKTNEFHDFRGFAGKLTGAPLSVGDEITVLPSLNRSRIKEIRFYKDTFETANPGSSFVLSIEDEINISRGDMMVKSSELPIQGKQISAKVCWMDTQPLLVGKTFSLQHGVNRVMAKVDALESVYKTDFSAADTSQTHLNLNEIGQVRLKLSKPIFYDAYAENKFNGAFILIDNQSHFTSGVGLLD